MKNSDKLENDIQDICIIWRQGGCEDLPVWKIREVIESARIEGIREGFEAGRKGYAEEYPGGGASFEYTYYELADYLKARAEKKECLK